MRHLSLCPWTCKAHVKVLETESLTTKLSSFCPRVLAFVWFAHVPIFSQSIHVALICLSYFRQWRKFKKTSSHPSAQKSPNFHGEHSPSSPTPLAGPSGTSQWQTTVPVRRRGRQALSFWRLTFHIRSIHRTCKTRVKNIFLYWGRNWGLDDCSNLRESRRRPDSRGQASPGRQHKSLLRKPPSQESTFSNRTVSNRI